MNNILWGLLGIVVIFGIAFLLSQSKRHIKIRTIIGGLAIQLIFAFIVLKWEFGREQFLKLTNGVQHVIDYAFEGVGFLFGSLGDAGSEVGFVFAFQVLTIIIFFSSLIAVLYHLGIMQWVIRLLGGGLAKLLGTSRTESLSASANIFVGQTEAPLVIRPYIGGLTKSELFAVMTGGLASVAGSVLFGYAMLGVPLEYLLAASFMAAPGGLIMAKMLVPETETTKDLVNDKEAGESDEDKAANLVDAAARGASEGLKLALNVGAMLLAFIALIALLNGFLGWVGSWFGAENFSLDFVLGYLFSPLAFVIGIPWSEAVAAGNLIGQKLVLNEFVAYSTFSTQLDMFSDKSIAVISFALCGFANLSSLAILLGGLGGLAPNRRSDIANLGFRAIIAGTLANLLSAAIAGMFIL